MPSGEWVTVGQVAGELGGYMTTFVATEATGGWAAANSLGTVDAMFVPAISCPQAREFLTRPEARWRW